MRNEVYFEYGLCEKTFAEMLRGLKMPVPIMATGRTTISVSGVVITEEVVAELKRVLDEAVVEGYEKTTAQYVGRKVVPDIKRKESDDAKQSFQGTDTSGTRG